jgi:hypothetical protein
MRKLLIVAALAGATLVGAAACATTPSASPSDSASPPGGSAPATTAAAADDTQTVCTQALALEKSNGATVLTKVQQYLADVAAGNTSTSAQTLADLLQIQQSWVSAFNGFAAQNVKPEVKTALQNFVTFVQGFGATGTAPNLAQIQQQYNQLDQALTAACAA